MKYPIKCVCCNKGLINEPYEICEICGWEDDKIQNLDDSFSGGANKISLMEYRSIYFKDRFVKHNNISFLENTGLVKAIYTMKGHSIWKNEFEGANESYLDLASTFGVSTDDLVMINQTHSSNIRIMTRENGGELVNRPMEQANVDGMITNEKGLMLCTVEADCVPVYILDPIKNAIGMIHSGWKGTANIISVNAIKLMKEVYDSEPEDIMIAIGPCMCGKCYEVGEELIEEFRVNFTETEINFFFTNKGNGKFLLDMKKAIKIALINNGIKDKNIYDTDVCTYENDSLCSWRRDKSKTARMLTAIMLK